MIGFGCISAFLYYTQMKKAVMRDALQQSEIILQEVEAIRQYVSSTIRPLAYELSGENDFIIELMSTTYVSLRIMDTFHDKMEGYNYRRVSMNPRNPENRADGHEEKMSDWFDDDRSRTFWQGMVQKSDGTFFVSMIPDYITQDCLHCHGKPENAPAKLLEKYGNHNGFRYEEGDLAGISSVAIPISKPLKRLRALTAMMFVLVVAASLGLLLLLNLLFDRLIVARLTRVINLIDGSNGPAAPSRKATRHISASDELDTLKDSFRHLSTYVRTAQKGSGQLPNFVGPYVIEKPTGAGTMSWLYSGSHSETGEQVTLKIPFTNISENPIYRTCYRNEIKILKNCVHPGILHIVDRIENILICPPLSGFHVSEDIVVKSNTQEALLFFTALFDMIAYLHTQGIVHHDIRPDIVLCSTENKPLLLDAGLAWWRNTPDVLHQTGLGPQGNPTFMAPEQLEGIRGDSRSDIYSLGIWFYFYFSSRSPFPQTPLRTKEMLKLKRNFTISGKDTNITEPGLSAILMRALASDPNKRYQWVEDFRDEILPYV
jgi:hypothetical protein